MGEISDLVFTVLGKLGRWMNVKGKRTCFVVWAICLLYWMARNWGMDLWVQTGGCLVSLCLHIYGYYNWRKNGIGEKPATAKARTASAARVQSTQSGSVARWNSADGTSDREFIDEMREDTVYVNSAGVRVTIRNLHIHS